MSRLVPVAWNDLVKRLRDLGFEGPIQGGKHPFMVKRDLVLTIPNLHHREIGVDLLVRILRQAKLSREEWLRR